jgi:hypothetical protein
LRALYREVRRDEVGDLAERPSSVENHGRAVVAIDPMGCGGVNRL